MKLIAPLICLNFAVFTLQAQTEAPAAILTPAQVEVITKQLKDLEKQIQDMRGSNLTAVMAKLRSAAASNVAAENFYLDCEKLVNVERKDLDKTEERQRKEQMDRFADRRPDKKSEEQDGDAGTAIRLHIQYLILTLEAHEAKPEDKSKLLPKLQAYIQEVVVAAEKLKGRAGGQLRRDLGESAIVQAYQIGRFLESEDWTTRPMDFAGMWSKFILPHFEKEKKDALAAQWDARINAEASINKARMPEPEFIIWGQQELPTLKWARADYLLRKGPSPVNALADMLNHIKAYPSHPDAPKWLEELRQAVQTASGPHVAPAAQ